MDNTLKIIDMTKDEIVIRVQKSIDVKMEMIKNADLMNRIEKVTSLLITSLEQGGKIMFCGNGGSAADAQHLAAELSGRFYFDRPPLNSEALHCNTSYLTAVANDYGYEFVYSRLLKGCGHRGDVIIGLSTSGNSLNIMKAFDTAHQMGIHTVGLTGMSGGTIKDKSDILINVPSTDTPRIQESHITIGHIICEAVEAALFKK